MKNKRHNQKPQHKGAVYCSAWCRHGCRWSEFKKAEAFAAKLAKSLGRGWTPHVWENMGWHWRVEYGTLCAVYPRSDGYRKFWIDVHVGGRQICLDAKNIASGIRAAISAAKDQAARTMADADKLAKAVA